MSNLVALMLDSGVFSAWNRNEKLDIHKYVDYIHEHKQYLFSYVSMDAMPGASDEYGSLPTAKEGARSGRESYEQHQIIKKAGLKPIPVFHQTESFEWLRRMIEDGDDYIGLSPWKRRITIDQQREWFDQVFTIITDKDGRPLIKTHGFGVTNPLFLLRYPFYSVDSTTWSLTPGFGAILVPSTDYKGGLNYKVPPYRFITSGVQQQTYSAHKRQLEWHGMYADSDLKMHNHAHVEQWLKSIGISLTEIRYNPDSRRKATLYYFVELAKHLVDVRFRSPVSGLFWKEKRISGKPIKPFHPKIMYATNMALKAWSELLTDMGANTRLLSYFETRNKSEKELRMYVKTGTTGKYTKRRPKTDWNSEAYRNFRRLALMSRLTSVANAEVEEL